MLGVLRWAATVAFGLTTLIGSILPAPAQAAAPPARIFVAFDLMGLFKYDAHTPSSPNASATSAWQVGVKISSIAFSGAGPTIYRQDPAYGRVAIHLVPRIPREYETIASQGVKCSFTLRLVSNRVTDAVLHVAKGAPYQIEVPVDLEGRNVCGGGGAAGGWTPMKDEFNWISSGKGECLSYAGVPGAAPPTGAYELIVPLKYGYSVAPPGTARFHYESTGELREEYRGKC